MRLLVIEDEPKTLAYLKKGLGESGFTVDTARTGTDGLHLAMTDDYDLLVLDVMLPGLDGWAVVERLRARKSTPVLFLSARDDLDDRIHGLELGGDDYLVKPFAFVELLARIRTLLRRGPARDMEHLVVGELEIDVVKRRVRRGGVRIDLTSREFALLRRHPVYRAAIERGATEIWMPRLYAAQQIEARRITYRQAADGAGTPPLGVFDRSRVHRWLAAMDTAFAPIASWMP